MVEIMITASRCSSSAPCSSSSVQTSSNPSFAAQSSADQLSSKIKQKQIKMLYSLLSVGRLFF